MNTQTSISFIADRRGRANSAVYVNNGYANIDVNSVSFVGDYAVAAWVAVQGSVGCSKIVNCGIVGQNVLVWSLNWCNGLGDSIEIFIGGGKTGEVWDGTNLAGLGWVHIAITQSGTTAYVYRNGVNQASGTQYSSNVPAGYGSCAFGRSLWGDGNINSYVDDLWFFSRYLSSTEINTVMNYYV